MDEPRQRQAKVVRVLREEITPAALIAALGIPEAYILMEIGVMTRRLGVPKDGVLELVFQAETIEEVE
jgi:hypothetical protein